MLLRPSEMDDGDLVAELYDDVVVRQSLGNDAPCLAMKRVPRSDLPLQLRRESICLISAIPQVDERLLELVALGPSHGVRLREERPLMPR